MHHSAIRIHLTRLEEAGLIVSQALRQRGVVGRPQLVYLPNSTVTSFTLPPRNYELLARVALEYAVAGVNGDSSAEDFGTAWGRAYVQSAQANDQLPLAEALPALVTELRALGGNPELIELAGDGYALVEHNCLFGDISASHKPLVCSLHQGIAEGILQGLTCESFQWTPRSTLAGGADHCRVNIQPASASMRASASMPASTSTPASTSEPAALEA